MSIKKEKTNKRTRAGELCFFFSLDHILCDRFIASRCFTLACLSTFQNSKELQTANRDLEVLIKDLKREKLNLEAMLNKHKCLLNNTVEEVREM